MDENPILAFAIVTAPFFLLAEWAVKTYELQWLAKLAGIGFLGFVCIMIWCLALSTFLPKKK